MRMMLASSADVLGDHRRHRTARFFLAYNAFLISNKGLNSFLSVSFFFNALIYS